MRKTEREAKKTLFFVSTWHQSLMDRNLPRNFIGVLLDWLLKSFVCVRWCGIFSFQYRITAGVRQGGILSPVLFAIYMDTLIKRLRSSGLGCKIVDKYYGCLVYADDILLLSYTASAMRAIYKYAMSLLLTLI